MANRFSRMYVPSVSVIIPAYRAEATIVAALASLRRQTRADWEAVIASDDDVDYLAVLAASGISDKRVRQVSTAFAKSGPGRARNCAMQSAKASFIANLDADDDFAPDRLERLLPLAEAFGAVIDNTAVYEMDGHLMKTGFGDTAETSQWAVQAPEILSPRVPFFPVFQRELAGEGWLDLLFAEDVLFNLELLQRAKAMQAVAYSGYRYRKRDGSITQSAGTADAAGAAYAEILEILRSGRLGLRPGIREPAMAEFERNRQTNAHFRQYVAAGRCRTLEQFLAMTDNGRHLDPVDLAVTS